MTMVDSTMAGADANKMAAVQTPLEEANARLTKSVAEIEALINVLVERLQPLQPLLRPDAPKPLGVEGPDTEGRADQVRFIHSRASDLGMAAVRLSALIDRLDV